MISFKQFITEARMAPLYHATSFDNFRYIVKENLLKATIYGNGQRSGTPTNFFTRDLKNAKHYAMLVHNSDYFVFKVDQLKLNQRYKIQPIHNWSKQYYSNSWSKKKTHKGYLANDNSYGVEFEEIVGQDIKNFLTYVTNIYFNGQLEVLDTALTQEVKDMLDKYNLKIEKLK